MIEDWSKLYSESLTQYLRTGQEEELEQAYQLGRDLVSTGQGLLEMVSAHTQALSLTLPEQEKVTGCVPAVERASAFLNEGLSPFEMALRGFIQANSALQNMNATLERRVEDRTRDLQLVNAELQAILRHAPTGIVSTDPHLAVRSINPAAERHFGLGSGQSALGRPLLEIAPWLEPSLPQLQQALQGEPVELRGVSDPVSGRSFDVLPRPISDGAQAGGLLLITMDITKRRRSEEKQRELERQILVTQRMEAVGRLAGGVAHDFNNILTIIQSYSTFLVDAIQEGDPAREDAEAILDAAKRAAQLTRQLLTFSRGHIQELSLVNINQSIDILNKMLQRLIGEDIKITTELAPDLALIKADVTQFEQVLVNLVVNARDAMPRGGRIGIQTANVQIDETEAAALGAHVLPGGYVRLSIADTGVGMDEETRARIFEPFFTTKATGTGLGLATVYGIVKKSGGFLLVRSELGSGTTFEVYLPQSQGEAAEAPRVRAAARAGGGETLLLVEDEEQLGRAAARALTRQGYRVLEANDGKAALALAGQHQGRIHLVITDVVMPEMSGPDLIERLRQSNPGAKVLYMSGYTDKPLAHDETGLQGVSFLQKPFLPDALLRKVRQILDGETAAPDPV